MAPEPLVEAAGHIADGDRVDWLAIREALATSEQQEIAEELQLVEKIAAGHRQLHDLLPPAASTPTTPADVRRHGSTYHVPCEFQDTCCARSPASSPHRRRSGTSG